MNLRIYSVEVRNVMGHGKDSNVATLELKLKQTFRLRIAFLLAECYADQSNYS